MKIIEAMKQVKDLLRKAEDLRGKVHTHCLDLDIENPVYEDQAATVAGWIQAHHDILREVSGLRAAIQRTNLATEVTIEVGGKQVTKSITEWIYRRRDLADLDAEMWRGVTRREGQVRDGELRTTAGETRAVHVRRYYSPQERDERHEAYRSEPSRIDATLEVVNAVTDLVVAA